MRTIQERMAEIKAAQEAGTYTRCPRCGEHTMKLGDRLYTNALSRSYDIMICDLYSAKRGQTWRPVAQARRHRKAALDLRAASSVLGRALTSGGTYC